MRRAAFFVILAALGCGGERPGGPDAAQPAATTADVKPKAAPSATASAGDTIMDAIEPEIHAEIHPASVPAGKTPALTMTVRSKSPGLLFVPDPRRGGDSLTLHVRPPAGDERVFTTGSANRTGGVRPMLANFKILPGESQSFDLELASLTQITDPGRYTVTVEYEWSPGRRFRSPELAFTVTPH